jgi:ribose transport system substrate-binding protein
MRRLRTTQAAAMIAMLALTVSACGSDDDSASTDSAAPTTAAASGGGVETAKANVAAAMGVPKFVAPGPAFDAAAAKGKTIAMVPDYPSLPFVQEINSGLKEAAGKAGVTLKDCQNNGTVGEWVKCFNQAITAKPDLILLNGSPSPSQLQPQIAAAKKAGIPVIANHVPLDSEFPEGTLPATNTTGLAGVQAGPFTEGAKLMADYAIANQPAGTPVNALIVTANEAPASRGLVKMIQNEFAANGEGTKNTVLNVPITDWATKLQDATRTALLKDPSINWVIPIYDGAYSAVLPGVRGSGRADKIKTVSFNGQGYALESIENGTATATAGENLAWTGWSTIDQALRILATGKAVDTTKSDTPIRVWDKSNIADAGTPPKPTVGYGDSYKDEYLKLWGLGQ